MAVSRVTAGLASACALIVGIGAGHWLLDEVSAAPPAPTAPASGESSELASLLRELERSVQALTRAVELRGLSAATVPPAESREPMGTDAPTPPDSGELAFALRELAAAIGELHSGAAPARGQDIEELVTPAWVDREGAFAATGMRQAAASGEEVAWARSERAFRVKHLFMTTQEVLSTYGAPDSIEVESDTRWWKYVNDFEGGREEFYFGFDEGTVYDVGYSMDRR